MESNFCSFHRLFVLWNVSVNPRCHFVSQSGKFFFSLNYFLGFHKWNFSRMKINIFHVIKCVVWIKVTRELWHRNQISIHLKVTFSFRQLISTSSLNPLHSVDLEFLCVLVVEWWSCVSLNRNVAGLIPVGDLRCFTHAQWCIKAKCQTKFSWVNF